MTFNSKKEEKRERRYYASSLNAFIKWLSKLKMEGELDTQELKHSMDLDSSSENVEMKVQWKFKVSRGFFRHSRAFLFCWSKRFIWKWSNWKRWKYRRPLLVKTILILSHLSKKFQIIRIFKPQRQRLNVLVIQIGVNVGCVNQWERDWKFMLFGHKWNSWWLFWRLVLALLALLLALLQKQPLELLCEKRCSLKCCKIQRKTPVPESLF